MKQKRKINHDVMLPECLTILFLKLNRSLKWWYAMVVPPTQEAETEGAQEFKTSLSSIVGSVNKCNFALLENIIYF